MASSTRVLAGVENIPVERQVIVNQAIVEVKQEEQVAPLVQEVEVRVAEDVSSVVEEKMPENASTENSFFPFKVKADLSVSPVQETETVVEQTVEGAVQAEAEPVVEESPIVEPVITTTTTASAKKRR